jgi:hypothetical protein
MTSQEAFNPNSPQGNEYPEWFNAAQLTDEQKTRLVASRIAKALLDSDNQLILETLYEGSSFTPTIGGEIGFVSGEHDLDPVRAGIKELRSNGVLAFERNDITETESVEITDDKTIQREIPVLLIRVIFDQEKARNFVAE